MRYEAVAAACRDLERATGRLEMVDRLGSLFRETPPDLLPTVVMLCLGRIAPDFAGIDIGLAERLAARAVARVADVPVERVHETIRETGDLGLAAERLLAERLAAERPPAERLAVERPLAERPAPPAPDPPVQTVFDTLHEIAAAAGAGSQGRKLDLMSGLLEAATPLSARYLVRTVTGTLRVGIGAPTVLDALAQVYAGGRKSRPVLERAYHVCSDLGLVAATLIDGGLEALGRIHVRPGVPVRPMLAQRLSSTEEILAKLGAPCAAEYKYDGMRVQAHRTADGTIELYTRRLERVATQFPDVVALLAAGLRPGEAILEGEVVAFDPVSAQLRPFQEVMFRRRKHGIEEAVGDFPVSLFCFDLLYADGEDLTRLPYQERRARLAAAVEPAPTLRLATAEVTGDVAALEAVFQQAVADGCEGLVCKSLAPDAGYRAGARGWLWIKLKRDYRTELSDTMDLVVVGALYGRGRRVGVYGALLLAAYDAATDTFQTVTKCGAGFSDADLAALPARMAPLVHPERPARVDSPQTPDVWFEPGLVIEVLAAEITPSPNYTAGRGALGGSGLALRFPRFTGRWRDDKAPEDATTTDELVQLHRLARKEPA